MSPTRPLLLALLLLATGCDEESAPPAAAPAAVAQAPAPPDAGPGAELARLEGLSGEVRLERGGGTGPASAGPLYGGDAVETGAGGSATVRFTDGRVVEVGPEARFVLGEDAGGIVLQVERGLVLSRVPAAAKPAGAAPTVALSILTPFGLTRVGSGEPSEVSVQVEKDTGRLEVRLGTIEFVGKDGQQVRAGEGESVEVSAGRAELVARSPRVVELAPIAVTVRLGSGRAEVKPKGSVRWRPVRKDGEALAPGDGVRTRVGGTAVLALQGSSSVLSLGSNAELVLEAAGQGGTTDEAKVDLRQGALGLKLAAGRDSRVALAGLLVEAGGLSGVEVRRTATGYRVDALTGQVTLVRGGTRQALRAGERATLEGEAGAPQVEPLAPAQVALGGGAAEVFHSGLPEVAFTWEGEGEAVVEVASDAGFTRPLLSGTVFRPFVNVQPPARGTLYWRARRKDGTEVASGSASFGPERARGDLDRLRNVVPEGPEKTTIFYQDKPPAVTFTYGEEPRAARYRVAVYRVGALGTPVAERTVTETRAALEAGALGEGSYLWSVIPLSASGAQLKGGRMNKLEMVYDNSVPVLVISTPRQGQRAAERIRTTGVAPVDARLSINGRAVPLDGKHRFSTWVEPVGSPPMLVFKMIRPGAPEVHTVRTLKQRGP